MDGQNPNTKNGTVGTELLLTIFDNQNWLSILDIQKWLSILDTQTSKVMNHFG